MKTVKIKVYGRVQGVFLRANTKEFCDKVRIKGYVRNCDDGSVEIVACGSERDLEKLVGWLKSSPGASRVENVKVKEIEVEEKFEGFEIRREDGFLKDKGKAVGNLFRSI